MKIFVTGATGFLGSKLMENLVDDEKVSEITIVSRSNPSYTNKKVKVICADLTKISELHETIICDFDAIYHLAGLYDFDKDESLNYVQNVVSTSNLISWVMSSNSKPKIFFSSTYAVGVDQWGLNLPEGPITALPEAKFSYARTKAIAEKCLTNTRFDWTVFRLGVLVGDSKSGKIQKVDGPYYNYRALKKLSKTLSFTKIPIPFFADKKSFLPFVPVDSAAKVLHEALHKIGIERKIYGVYNKKSTRVHTFAKALKKQFGLTNRMVYLPVLGDRLSSLVGYITNTPRDIFQYAADTPQLENSEFEKDFHDCRIPAFKSYEKAMFKGAENQT